MKFAYKESQKNQPNELIYVDEDYAFTTPVVENIHAVIQINELQLGCDYDTNQIIRIWGYCPLGLFISTDEFPNNYSFYNLNVLLDKEPIPGISYSVKKGQWPVFINKSKGWVCLGNPKVDGYKLIEFLPGCVATFDGEDLIALWLHPKELPDYIYED